MTSKFAMALNNFVGRGGLSVRHMIHHVMTWASRDPVGPIISPDRDLTPNRRTTSVWQLRIHSGNRNASDNPGTCNTRAVTTSV